MNNKIIMSDSCNVEEWKKAMARAQEAAERIERQLQQTKDTTSANWDYNEELKSLLIKLLKERKI